MIQCNQCGFSVLDSMKFSLINNVCAACGSKLLSDEKINIITKIQGGIKNQNFAFNFTKEILYDLSLYIFNEIESGLYKDLLEDLVVNDAVPEAMLESEVDPILRDIRKEVEAEFQEEIEELSENEDLFGKAERLKRLAQQRRVDSSIEEKPRITANRKTGVSVKRAG